MTNKERIIKELCTTENLADYLVRYNEEENMFITSDGNGYYFKLDAIKHEIKWLQSESKI